MIRKLIHFLKNLFKRKSKKNYNKTVDWLLSLDDQLDEFEKKIS